jgi:hypothetical protein
MKRAMESSAELERLQVVKIQEAQRLINQDNYFKGRSDEEIIRYLLNNSVLSSEDISMFLSLLSGVDIETSGEVMSTNLIHKTLLNPEECM